MDAALLTGVACSPDEIFEEGIVGVFLACRDGIQQRSRQSRYTNKVVSLRDDSRDQNFICDVVPPEKPMYGQSPGIVVGKGLHLQKKEAFYGRAR